MLRYDCELLVLLPEFLYVRDVPVRVPELLYVEVLGVVALEVLLLGLELL